MCIDYLNFKYWASNYVDMRCIIIPQYMPKIYPCICFKSFKAIEVEDTNNS